MNTPFGNLCPEQEVIRLAAKVLGRESRNIFFYLDQIEVDKSDWNVSEEGAKTKIVSNVTGEVFMRPLREVAVWRKLKRWTAKRDAKRKGYPGQFPVNRSERPAACFPGPIFDH